MLVTLVRPHSRCAPADEDGRRERSLNGALLLTLGGENSWCRAVPGTPTAGALTSQHLLRLLNANHHDLFPNLTVRAPSVVLYS